MSQSNPLRREARALLNQAQVAAIYGLHKNLGRDFSSGLTELLRTRVDVKSPTVEQLAYATFLAKVDQPTCVAVVRLAPTEADAAIHLSPSIVFPMVDRLLGGRDTETVVQRPFTAIEQRLVRKVFDLLLNQWSRSLREAVAIELSIATIESDAGLAQIASTYEPVLRVRFELSMAAARGALQFCIPCAALAKYADALVPKDRQIAATGGEAVGASIDLVVTLAETRLPAAQAAALRPGDVIVTDTTAQSLPNVEIDMMRRLRGRVGQIDGRRSVRIVKT